MTLNIVIFSNAVRPLTNQTPDIVLNSTEIFLFPGLLKCSTFVFRHMFTVTGDFDCVCVCVRACVCYKKCTN